MPYSLPFVYVTDQLYKAFDSADNRKSSWLKSINVSGKDYYYPFKYKIGQIDAQYNSQPGEYYMVLRLAEQYLIRAEARAKLNNLSGAIVDLNIVHQRAGLPALSSFLTQSQITAAIEKERQVELFAEWGHRWLDLKRWGKADAILSAVKGTNWQSTDKLYPIPYSELFTGPNLIQNPGYN